MLVPVILSGGSGTRLWPVSRESFPKQFWPLISDRNSCQSSFGIFRKTSTTVGSNCDPEHRRISSRATSKLRALRYGRSLVIASRVSATANIRAPTGISRPRFPFGYPLPSKCYWWLNTMSAAPAKNGILRSMW